MSKKAIIRQRIRQAQKRGQHINPDYLASCYGKVRRTKEDARNHAEMLGIKFYKCRHCDYYHAGHG